MSVKAVALMVAACASLASCFADRGVGDKGSQGKQAASDVVALAPSSFAAPESIPRDIIERLNEGRASFVPALERVIANDASSLLVLVDKKRLLDPGYEPRDLVPVGGGRSYVPNRDGLSLRREAEEALESMAMAARADGVTLVVSSTYRSWSYQKRVYERNVRELGQAAADRESAMPGASQHQLGTAVDFGSITDEYAETKAGTWLQANASRFGWSLSFPDGYEGVTGFRWECWHYRYVGVEACRLQDEWFDGVQQYMIEFVDAWKARPLRNP